MTSTGGHLERFSPLLRCHLRSAEAGSDPCRPWRACSSGAGRRTDGQRSVTDGAGEPPRSRVESVGAPSRRTRGGGCRTALVIGRRWPPQVCATRSRHRVSPVDRRPTASRRDAVSLHAQLRSVAVGSSDVVFAHRRTSLVRRDHSSEAGSSRRDRCGATGRALSRGRHSATPQHHSRIGPGGDGV